MTTEQLLIDSWRSLPEESRREALEFIQALLQKKKRSVPVPEGIKRQLPPPELSGKVKIFGDIVAPIVDEEDWECLN